MRLGRAGAAAALLIPPLTEFRLKRAAQPVTGRWRQLPVERRGMTQVGISFRPLQATALGLDPQAALQALLAYPFQLIRLGAYWNRIEPRPGAFQPGDLDRQLDAAERAGKQVILCVGPVKTFGYPEFFVPAHHLSPPLALYLAGSRAPWQQRRRERLLDQVARTDARTGGARARQRVMIAEGQAEPWEAVTTPPSPAGRAMYSCRPEDLIGNYNQCMRWTDGKPSPRTGTCSGGLSTGCSGSDRAIPVTWAPSGASWRTPDSAAGGVSDGPHWDHLARVQKQAREKNTLLTPLYRCTGTGTPSQRTTSGPSRPNSRSAP